MFSQSDQFQVLNRHGRSLGATGARPNAYRNHAEDQGTVDWNYGIH